jgi:hypothetical protein
VVSDRAVASGPYGALGEHRMGRVDRKLAKIEASMTMNPLLALKLAKIRQQMTLVGRQPLSASDLSPGRGPPKVGG